MSTLDIIEAVCFKRHISDDSVIAECKNNTTESIMDEIKPMIEKINIKQ